MVLPLIALLMVSFSPIWTGRLNWAALTLANYKYVLFNYSLTQQAIQLGFMPRLRVEHTSASAAGQIYIPLINWGLMTMVILLVLVFKTSSNLTAAYGIAVTGAMFIDNLLLTVLLYRLWHWKWYYAAPLLAVFFLVDGAYLAANLTKVPDGGWFLIVPVRTGDEPPLVLMRRVDTRGGRVVNVTL